MRSRPVRHAKTGTRWTVAVCTALAAGALSLSSPAGSVAEPMKRYQYWATSLARTVDDNILEGLYAAVARGAVGWLDVDAKYPIPQMKPGINLVLYHVGGNCYVGDDCDRFPSSEETGDRWGDKERAIDLTDPAARTIVVNDLIALVRKGDEIAPAGSVVGIHFDNVHRIDAQTIAAVFNEFLKAVEAAKTQGLISKSRQVGYVAKNNPRAFKAALDQGLLNAPPLYQINENATLSQDGALDRASQRAQEIGRQYCIPVFLKTFGSDAAYAVDQDDNETTVYVSEEMTHRMAEKPNISGAAWSPDEGRYRPTIFAEGSPLPQGRSPAGGCRED